ncbi:MAG: M1 family metallopeptidase, partial [Planctomycetota bacterium]|nr:M1 family metallopeptidase [Planctomycetota bacterium]
AEYFKKDKNYIYEIAHWFPRMAAYTDVNGWQHKQFLGRGEFTLEFGNYKVAITAPSDHIVASTGVLQNVNEVLTKDQKKRYEAARTAKKPMFIVTPKEAKANEKSRSKKTKTWIYKAKNVRDFAFASSRKFIWDAQGIKRGKRTVMCMSYYPNEGEPLWSRYSTHSIIHTINVYSRYTFDYPYPVAISVNGPVGGMEYPMICFNGPRPEKDGTYSPRTKYGLISVIIHEVGHNYFPMIVNSDERQWTWMDEGLNTFVQYLAEQEWEENYPSRRGEPANIVGYMKSTEQVPIMTNSESILRFGSNAYAKPATALNILRESILGRELFDFAFKEYARRWKFKRPQPADFFRTMEDASGVDLDWFWRGWFYSTNHCDIAIDKVAVYTIDPPEPEKSKGLAKKDRSERPETLSKKRNKNLARRADKYPELYDFYNKYDELNVTDGDKKSFKRFWASLTKDDKALFKIKRHFTVVHLKNIGGLVMPIVLRAEFKDGTSQEFRIPAEIWRQNSESAAKLLLTKKEVKSITLDPHLETADVDLSNNFFPPKPSISRFKLFKQGRRWGGGTNPMRNAREEAKARAKGKADKKKDAKKKDAKKKRLH